MKMRNGSQRGAAARQSALWERAPAKPLLLGTSARACPLARGAETRVFANTPPGRIFIWDFIWFTATTCCQTIPSLQRHLLCRVWIYMGLL